MPRKAHNKIINKEITADTATSLGEDPALVRLCTNSMFTFIRDRISDGGFEEVYIRKFGRFTPREKIVSQIQESNGYKLVRRLMRQTQKTHETIPNSPGLHTGAEPPMDPPDTGVRDDNPQG